MGEPISSSPSTNTVTPTGGAPSCARRAATWAMMPALSSAAPRPYNRPCALRRHERLRRPVVRVTGGLHVVVRVQQHGRLPVRRRTTGHHRRCSRVDREDLHLGEAKVPEQLGGRLGGRLHVADSRGVSAHRRDADQPLEVGPDAGKDCVDGCAEIFGHSGERIHHAAGWLTGPDEGRTVRWWS